MSDPSRVVGMDVTASRIRVVSVGGGKVRPLLLDAPAEDLLLFLACDRRAPEVGRAGYGLCRKAPHAVCSGFLPALGQPRDFRAGRHALTAESALELAFQKVREQVAAESEAGAIVLPAYLAPGQAAKVVLAATRAKLPFKGTAVAPLAVAAHRAAAVLAGKQASAPTSTEDSVIPMRPPVDGPGSVVVVDADEYAISASVIAVDREAVRLVTSGCWPKVGVRVWKERLLDALADRCVRLCRRDPRDSADAEQSLFEQLDEALDRVRAGQRVTLTVRTAHWYQDLIQQPDEFDAACSALAKSSSDGLQELVSGAGLPVPPRTVWLTHAASRLPGLAWAVHQSTPEGTAVEVLPPGAVAHAAAALVPRWLSDDLPRVHLDTLIALPPDVGGAKGASSEKKASSRSTRSGP